jgi:hypothetical protein
MNAEQRLALLLESEAKPSGRGRLTHAWVAENVSLTVADGVYAAINAVSVPTALRYVTGNGIDTAAALWKAQATAVAASSESLAPHLVLLRDFELVYLPRWQIEGYQSAPTLDSVSLELQKQQLADAAADAYQAFREALSTWNGSGDAPVLGGG